MIDTYAQLPVNALRRELRGEPYAGKPHVRFGEGGMGRASQPRCCSFLYSINFRAFVISGPLATLNKGYTPAEPI